MPSTATPGRTAPAWTDQTWRRRASCLRADPEIFFPANYGHGHYGRQDVIGCKVCDPVRICRACPVREQCFEDVMRVEDRAKSSRAGIRAGTTPSQRDAIYRRDPGKWDR